MRLGKNDLPSAMYTPCEQIWLQFVNVFIKFVRARELVRRQINLVQRRWFI